MSAACERDVHDDTGDEDGEDVQLISGEVATKKGSDDSSIIDKCIDASENNGNLIALYTFALAMVS